jgi:hypothetical protein
MNLFWLGQVPWGKFFLLWILAVLMGGSLLWLHWGFTSRMVPPLLALALGTGLSLLWATQLPRWRKAHCAWCGARVRAGSSLRAGGEKGLVWVYKCEICGQVTEKSAMYTN